MLRVKNHADNEACQGTLRPNCRAPSLFNIERYGLRD